MEPVDATTARRFADALPETPESFSAACALRRQLGLLWLDGSPEAPRAAVVQATWIPREPMAFGSDPEAIADLLQSVPRWTCANVPAALAPRLASAIERRFGFLTDLVDHVYYLPEGDVAEYFHPLVRHLDGGDVELLESADPGLHPVGFSSAHAALEGGIVAGAVVSGRLVGAMGMNTSSDTYADIGGATLEEWRGKGIATAAASLVARAVVDRGLVPVWSTGGSNLASRRVAEKLGFREASRAAYVVVPELVERGGYRPT